MRALAVVTLLALAGLPDSCSKPSCESLTRAVALACDAAPESEACVEAKVLLARNYPTGCSTQPTPTPTPVPTPTPSPTPAPLCVIDFATLDLVEGGPASAELDDAIKLAEINAHPEGCDSGRCVLNMSRPQWHNEVCQELRVAGLCCGYTDADEITVGRSNQPGTRVVNAHVFVGPGEGPGTVLWPPQARRDGWTLKLRGDVEPPPEPAACGDPQPPPLCAFGMQAWTGRPGTECYNASPLVGCGSAREFCAAVGYTDGRSTCAVRPDCNPEAGPCRFTDKVACEALIAPDPTWSYPGALEHPKDGRGERSPWRICVTAGEAGELKLCSGAFCKVVDRP